MLKVDWEAEFHPITDWTNLDAYEVSSEVNLAPDPSHTAPRSALTGYVREYA